MPLDDLFKAFDSFKQSAQEYQQTQAVNDARSQLNQLQYDESKKAEYLQKTSQIGQDLALRLTSAQASPERISAAVGGLVPSASVVAQGEGGLSLEKLKTAGSETVAKIHERAALGAAQIHADAILGKDSSKEQAKIPMMPKEFANMPEIKPVITAAAKVGDAINNLQDFSGQKGITALTSLAQLGMIRNAAGRVNQQEIEGSRVNQSVRDQIWQRLGLEATGETPTNVTDFWKKVLANTQAYNQKFLQDAAEGFAKGKEIGSNGKIKGQQVKDMLQAQFGHVMGTPARDAADVSAALDWLNSPEGMKADAATRQAVTAKIKEKQGR